MLTMSVVKYLRVCFESGTNFQWENIGGTYIIGLWGVHFETSQWDGWNHLMVDFGLWSVHFESGTTFQ